MPIAESLPQSEKSAAAPKQDLEERLHFLFFPLRQKRSTSLALGTALILVIAVIDWRSADDVPLGFLYLLPMLIMGRLLQPWQTLLTAAACTFLTERFDPFPWNFRTGFPRDVLYFSAFSAIGIFVFQTAKSRSIIEAQVRHLELESAARLEAEQQSALLIETSPAAIVTTDLNGTILAANEAAHRIFAVPHPTLLTRDLISFLPSVRYVLQQSRQRSAFRLVMEAHGQRLGGEGFLAELCFSTYSTSAGERFTAMIIDTSEEYRSREESSLHQILAGSRIAVSALSHEIRNICGAIAAVHRNIRNEETLQDNQDFEALGNLVIGLERLATIDLRPSPECLIEVDLALLIEDLKIVISPSLQEAGIAATWSFAPEISTVWADGTGLMQVLLNLTTNSIRVLSSRKESRSIMIGARMQHDLVCIDVQDNGGGVVNEALLFRPFQSSAQKTGLGLYVARAFARSFGGDLQYHPVPGGARFTVTLEPANCEA